MSGKIWKTETIFLNMGNFSKNLEFSYNFPFSFYFFFIPLNPVKRAWERSDKQIKYILPKVVNLVQM